MQPDFLVDFPGLGIHDLPVNRVAFELFGRWPVYWYGLLIAFALVLCLLLAMRQAPKFSLTPDDVMDTFIVIIPLMIVMARLFYVVFEWEYFSQDLRRVFSTRDGGLAFYGGVIGGVIAIIVITRVKKISLVRLLDFFAVYVPLGQAIGRWGNFFNQEAFGTNTTLPWGMYSNQTDYYLQYVTRVTGLNPDLPVHPTFFYEFAANLLIFFWLLRVRKKSTFPLQTTLWYLLLYGMVRYFVESIRTDPLVIGNTGIRISMLLSALMVVGSIVFLIVLKRRQMRLELTRALSADDSETSAEPAPEDSEDASADFVAIEDELPAKPADPDKPASP
ncbi:MAG: prolipoprotein diacylglyceryl transferase [Clostridiaceae bacterium]|nr:prolipoprotein diacylglyceryl transferase [Clostridiales bacterium]MDD2440553.1 prolipoprotein diacylglyceryl transferase [Eubacteriales bacterium]MDD4138916.1 prolipoprotein diacylglyceryl transferase [Eubacteriales bacterium]NLB44233.1 prolipoprotein diacylglyceryl transferase [Clostridiaceae bacterium]